jgi:hypothetical protein
VYISKVAKRQGWTEAEKDTTLAAWKFVFHRSSKPSWTAWPPNRGANAASLVHEALERLVGYDEWFLREVEKGLAQIERGEVLAHEEVGSRLEKLLIEKQRRV